MLDKHWLLYFICILSGFALIHVSVASTFITGLGSILNLIGVLAVIVFAIVLIIHGVVVLFRRI